MKTHRLYIKDFMCYDRAFIDFNEFNSAIIIGKKENNDEISNGVGKTTIFRAIEYVLFNYADRNLEDVIRDDADLCNVTLDFVVGNQEYRVARSRTLKGTTDLTLYKRTGTDGEENEIYHTIKGGHYDPLFNDKYWEDISGRRAADTEKELIKLIKVNIKSFRIFVHFLQRDFGGLAMATPEKRKAILRDALSLIVYSKLEKIAKEKANLLTKEAEKFSTMIETLGDLDSQILDFTQKIALADEQLTDKLLQSNKVEDNLTALNVYLTELVVKHSKLEEKLSSLLVKEKSLNNEKFRIETSIKEYQTKKTNIIKLAHEAINELKVLEATQVKLAQLDFNQIDALSELIISNKENAAQLNLTIHNEQIRCEKLKKPIPADGECEECRQLITAEHRKICQQKLDEELRERQANILNCKKSLVNLTSQNTVHQSSISSLTLSKQHLEGVNTKIAAKKIEIAEKKTTYNDYSEILNRFITDLKEKGEELEQVLVFLKESSLDEAQILFKQIQTEKQKASSITSQISLFNKEIAHLNSTKAILQHDIVKKTEEGRKKIEYAKILKELQTKLAIYPSVIQAFSSTGIPNLIIQNVLDDLQIESNALLSQLKPGIQLAFSIEKTKGDGTEADTLDIKYTINGKKRYYETLSGAQQLAVSFSLKMGLSFLLQKMIGVDIKFLLLDEIDASLDKASVDSFVDIVKFFQKDYTVLVITHNDRLKDKFAHAILVEQDINMVSRAQVVSAW